MEYTLNQNNKLYQQSINKKTIDYNLFLKKLWIEFGHEEDIPLSDGWQSWKSGRGRM